MIDKHVIDIALASFSFSESEEFQVLQYFERNSTLRIVVKVTTVNGKSLVIKFFDDPDVKLHALEIHGRMSDRYLEVGVPVPKRYRAMGGKFYTTMDVMERTVGVTIEDFLPGVEMEKVSLSLLGDLGELLGMMHCATENTDLVVGNGSPWALFVGTEVDILGEFDENLHNALDFFGEMRKHPVNLSLLEHIQTIFNSKRRKLEGIWSALPKGAVQGDLSMNNILLDREGQIAGIIDFHLAGDEVFVNDMMSQGLYLSYSCDQVDEESPEMRDEYLRTFVSRYERCRPLSDTERGTLNLLYNILKPFRYQELKEVKRKASEGLYKDVNEHLENMLFHINRTMFEHS